MQGLGLEAVGEVCQVRGRVTFIVDDGHDYHIDDYHDHEHGHHDHPHSRWDLGWTLGRLGIEQWHFSEEEAMLSEIIMLVVVMMMMTMVMTITIAGMFQS